MRTERFWGKLLVLFSIACSMAAGMTTQAVAANSAPVVSSFFANMSSSTIHGSFTVSDDGGQVTKLRAHFDNAAGNSGISCYVDVGGAYSSTQTAGTKYYFFNTAGQCGTLFSQGTNGRYRSVIEAFDTATPKLQAADVYAYFGKNVVGASGVPQTGQNVCYNSVGTEINCSGTGQDGESQSGLIWPDPRFSDNNDQTVTDNLTGLIWSRKSGLSLTPTRLDWQQALNYIKVLNSQNYLGHNDWRLPNRIELESLLGMAQSDPATWLNSMGFSVDQYSATYWSSSTYSGNPISAWGADIGSNGNYFKSNLNWVWPVRSGTTGLVALPKTKQVNCYDVSGTIIACAGTGQDGELQVGTVWPDPRFASNPDQTMTDNLTGLIWSKDGNPATTGKTWQEALDYIKTLNSQNYLGHNDWRLPNRNELATLGFAQGHPVIGNWLLAEGFSNVQAANWYWTSSTFNSWLTSGYQAFAMYMYTGSVSAPNKNLSTLFQNSFNSVWPVRGGSTGATVATGTLPVNLTAIDNKRVGGALFIDAPFSDITAYKAFYLEKNGIRVAKIVVPANYDPGFLDLYGNLGNYSWTDLAGRNLVNWSEVLTEASVVPFRLLAQKTDGSWEASQPFNLSYQSQVSGTVSADRTFPQTAPVTVAYSSSGSGCSSGCNYRWLDPAAGMTSRVVGSGASFSRDYIAGGMDTIFLEISDSAGNISYVQVQAALNMPFDGGNPSDNGNGSRLINSVDVGNGNLHLFATDMSVPGKGLSFSITRAYNSLDRSGQWSFNVDQKMMFDWRSGNRQVSIIREDGRKQAFYRDLADGQWYALNPGNFESLKEQPDGSFRLYSKGSTILSFKKPNASGVGMLSAISDRDGNTITIASSFAAQKTVIDSVGRQYVLEYDDGGRLITATDFSGRSVQYTYDANGDMATVRDLRGYVTNYSYVGHQLATERDPRANAGTPYNSLSILYDAFGRVIKFTDAEGNVTDYGYGTYSICTNGGLKATGVIRPVTNGTTNNNLVFCRDSIGRVVEEITSYTVNNYRTKRQFKNVTSAQQTASQGLVDAVTNARNLNTNFGYSSDGRGNRISSTNAKSETINSAYKTENDYGVVSPSRTNLNVMTSFTTPLNNTYNFTHEDSGNIKTIKTPVAADPPTQFSYLPGGLVQAVTDPNGNATSYTYNQDGTVQQVRDAKNQTSNYTYDALGRVDTATDRRGVVTKYTYDAANNVLTITNAFGTPRAAIVTNTYDANGNLTTVRDARGNTRSYSYTKNNQLASESFTAGGITYTRSNTYDALGRLWKTTNENSNTSQMTFDAAGRKVADTDPLASTTTYIYDANGNVLTITDAMNHVTTYTYDELDRVKTVTDHLNNQVVNEYDAEGNLKSVRNPRGQYTYYNYDAVGNIVSVTDAAGNVTTATYDAAGNLKTVSGPANGNLVTYSYDELSRLISMADAGGRTWSYTYDANGNMLTSNVPGLGITTNQYDELNRLTQVIYPDNSTVQYGYDSNGNRTSMTDSSGTTSYSYDEANRLTSVTDSFGQTVGYTYDGVGNVKRIVYPGSKNLDYGYDAGERLNTVTNWLGRNTSYSYNAIHQLTQVVNGNGTKTTFGYDNANRMTLLQNLKGNGTVITSHSYTLDANGNVSQAAITQPMKPIFPSRATSIAFDAANRIITSGSTSFTHDLAGRIVAETTAGVTKNYNYNYRDLLTSITGGADNYSFLYNGDGNRTAITKNGLQIRYVLDQNGDLPNVLAETDSAGNVSSYYTYGNGLISKIDATSGQELWYHFDFTGNTLALTDFSQNITDRYAYTPYGEMTVDGASWNPFRYSGKHGIMDDGNGLNYMRARYFKPEIARFMSLDDLWGSIGEPQSLNRYSYVEGDPLGSIDPSGQYYETVKKAIANKAAEAKKAVNNTAKEAKQLYGETKKKVGEKIDEVKNFDLEKYLFSDAVAHKNLLTKMSKGENVTTAEYNNARKKVINKMISVGEIGVFVASNASIIVGNRARVELPYKIIVSLADEASKIIRDTPTISTGKMKSQLMVKLLTMVSTEECSELLKVGLKLSKMSSVKANKVYNVNTKEGKAYIIDIVGK